MTDISLPSTEASVDTRSGSDIALDALALLGSQKWLFFIVLLSGLGLSVYQALHEPRLYTASTIIMPPQQQQSSAAGALAQLGALAGMAGAGVGKAPDELYLSLLKTRRMQDALIERFKLKAHYGKSSQAETRFMLTKTVSMAVERKTGLITVAVDDQDAAFAASLANGHFEELRKLLATLAITEAQQRKQFYEQQVAKARDALAQAEQVFRQAQAEGGMVVSTTLAEAGVRAGIELRSQIATKETQLAAVSRFATEQSPERQRLAAELGALRQQLARLEQGDAGLATSAQRGQKALLAYRNMKVQEASLDALIRLYEVARVDESRDGPLIQQVDRADVPERFAKPSRAGMVLRGAFISLVAAVVLALGAGWWRSRRGQAASPAWRRLRAAWW
jgi:tyrosine-protein kinase Etk/Wzc